MRSMSHLFLKTMAAPLPEATAKAFNFQPL